MQITKSPNVFPAENGARPIPGGSSSTEGGSYLVLKIHKTPSDLLWMGFQFYEYLLSYVGMIINEFLFKLKNKLRKTLPNFILNFCNFDIEMNEYSFKKTDVKNDIFLKYGFDGDLSDIYSNNKNVIVHKWHHYIPIYDQYFSKFRNKKVRILEIGVSKGGSLQMWRKYFGPEAIIYGVDISPECSNLNGISGQVRIGSQIDSNFISSVIEEMGGVDIIIDDGSHFMKHVTHTLTNTFPLLNDNGIYLIEDLHTSYWRNFGGGLKSKHNFFNFLIKIINDMHHWYHWSGIKYPSIASHCKAIHIYDSIVIFEKSPVHRPTHSHVS